MAVEPAAVTAEHDEPAGPAMADTGGWAADAERLALDRAHAWLDAGRAAEASRDVAAVSRYALDTALRTFLVRTAWLLFALCWIGAQAARHDAVEISRLLAAGAVLGPAGYAYRFVSALPDHLRRYLLSLLSAGRRRTATGAYAVATALLLAVAAGPSGWSMPLLLSAVGAALLMRVTATSDMNDYLREHGTPVPYVVGTHIVWLAVWGCAGGAAFVLVFGTAALGARVAVAAGLMAGAGLLLTIIARRHRRARRR